MASQGSNQQIVKVPRAVILDTVVTASTAFFPAGFTIPNDADFEWYFLSIQRTDARLKILIAEQATNRNLIISGSPIQNLAFNGIFVDNLAGLVANNGSLPIAVPYVMPAARSYPHQFTDSSGANNTVQLAYHGFALINV